LSKPGSGFKVSKVKGFSAEHAVPEKWYLFNWFDWFDWFNWFELLLFRNTQSD